MTVQSTEVLGPTEIASLPEFTRSFFEKDPPYGRFSLFDNRKFLKVKVALPIEIEMDQKLGGWRERLQNLVEELRFRTFIVPSVNEQETNQKMEEAATTLYAIGYEVGLDGLKDPHFINSVADRLMRQGILYPQLQYKYTCAQIMIAGARRT